MTRLRQLTAKSMLASALLLPGIPQASVSFLDGIKLNEWSNAVDRTVGNNPSPADYLENGYFTGYVIGVSDMRDRLTICLPQGVTVGQLIAIVQKYLRANPEKWNHGAQDLVLNAFRTAFPCR